MAAENLKILQESIVQGDFNARVGNNIETVIQ